MKIKKNHIITGLIATALTVGTGIAITHTATKYDLDGSYPVVPGAINQDIAQANIGDTICNPAWSTKSIRPPVSFTNPIKVKLAKEINVDPTLYELDHRVALTDGGNPTDLNNLRLEPYNIPNGAKVKDQFEMQVHREICSSKITLAEGQKELMGDWTKFMNTAPTFGGIEQSDEDDI